MNTVRVFYSLLILSLLEAFLWSIPYCSDTAVAREYYARETQNFGCTEGHTPPFTPAGLYYHGEKLAAKVEAKASQRAFVTRLSLQLQQEVSSHGTLDSSSPANRGSSLFLFTPVESGTKEGSTGGSVTVAW
mmetsp:Transcript_33562/g.56353  ORF Transcript_33562/g.56353 Transcript_33562/m.56353 type:complete len:132 (-) Transcript_33562:1663-2058(-)